MLPEAPAVSPPATTEDNPTEQTNPRQHGLPPHESAVALSSANEHDAETGSTTTSSDEQLALDAALAASLQEEPPAAADTRPERRVSPHHSPSPPGRNRITEYEQAATPPVRRREGPAFEVLKKPRSPNDKRSPIQDLPNGRCWWCIHVFMVVRHG